VPPALGFWPVLTRSLAHVITAPDNVGLPHEPQWIFELHVVRLPKNGGDSILVRYCKMLAAIRMPIEQSHCQRKYSSSLEILSVRLASCPQSCPPGHGRFHCGSYQFASGAILEFRLPPSLRNARLGSRAWGKSLAKSAGKLCYATALYFASHPEVSISCASSLHLCGTYYAHAESNDFVD
jgi:hypothetical protein